MGRGGVGGDGGDGDVLIQIYHLGPWTSSQDTVASRAYAASPRREAVLIRGSQDAALQRRNAVLVRLRDGIEPAEHRRARDEGIAAAGDVRRAEKQLQDTLADGTMGGGAGGSPQGHEALEEGAAAEDFEVDGGAQAIDEPVEHPLHLAPVGGVVVGEAVDGVGQPVAGEAGDAPFGPADEEAVEFGVAGVCGRELDVQGSCGKGTSQVWEREVGGKILLLESLYDFAEEQGDGGVVVIECGSRGAELEFYLVELNECLSTDVAVLGAEAEDERVDIAVFDCEANIFLSPAVELGVIWRLGGGENKGQFFSRRG
ncbi:hypothetical protein MRB53_040776 [Persea americana]|nr:hypothetical protein MRB53_040776 [Persea americana]